MDLFIFSLWGGSVINLGTQKHKDKYFDGIQNLDYTGCFAMTELHHGNHSVFSENNLVLSQFNAMVMIKCINVSVYRIQCSRNSNNSNL